MSKATKQLSPAQAGRRLVALLATAACAFAVEADVALAHADYVSIEGSTLLFQRFAGALTSDQLTITYRSDTTGTYFVISDPTSTGTTNFPPCASLSRGDLDVRCPASGISQLLVNTRSGDNSITINAPTTAKLYGGSGNDSIRGGSGPTQFFGQGGNDTLTAGVGGGNVLLGGTGAERLEQPKRDIRHSLRVLGLRSGRPIRQPDSLLSEVRST
jgi:hypothetical protein